MSLEVIRYTEKAQTLKDVACGVCENPPLSSRGRIFFIQTSNWVILDLLERFRVVSSIHIMLEAMGGLGITQKFIFLTLIMLSLLQNVHRAIK